VGNGDCTLLWVGETRILIDLSPRIQSGDPHYDVEEMRDELLPLVRRDDGRYVVDAFLITHPDRDHVLEAEELLHLGAPDDYDADDERILVEEIIYVPASFEAQADDLSSDAKAVLSEIERRLDADSSAGNLVTALIGPNGEDPGADRVYSVGRVIDIFGAATSDERLAAVVYAPRGVLDPQDRNDVSGVVQFSITPTGSVEPVRIIMGGDAPYEVWEDICDNESLDDFKYDLMLAPHHCSWSVFGESNDHVPSEKVIDLFKNCHSEAKIVSSSFAIDSDGTLPNEEAAEIYRGIVGEDDFYCTGEYPSKDEHVPIVFEFSDSGVQESDGKKRGKGGGRGAAALIRRTPQRYGMEA
jgi:hypothetical protein